jgi:hypothetical protein
MQRLEVSGAVRPIEGSLGVKGLIIKFLYREEIMVIMPDIIITIIIITVIIN